MARKRKECPLPHEGMWEMDDRGFPRGHGRVCKGCGLYKGWKFFYWELDAHNQGHNRSTCADCERGKGASLPTPVAPLTEEQKAAQLEMFDIVTQALRLRFIEAMEGS